METKQEKIKYIQELVCRFDKTLFVWSFKKPEGDELLFTKPRVYEELKQGLFWRKENIFRAALWDDYSDEFRLDLDYKDMNKNVESAVVIIEKLKSVGIDKFLLYHTGGKGLHIHLRYMFDFDNFPRKEIRKALWKSLNLKVPVDETLFRTNQILGLESSRHRKTQQIKQLIEIKDNKIVYLDKGLCHDYLTNKYVNELDEYTFSKMLNILQGNKETKPSIPYTPPAFYKSEAFTFHYDRFVEIYFDPNFDGKKRLIDMFIRYIYLTTKNIELTYYYFKLFCDSVDLKLSNREIKSRVDSSIDCMRAKAIFIYKDVLTKEQFYEPYRRTQ